MSGEAFLIARPNGHHDRRGAADLVVVGAGAIGLACAWRAARAGLEVRVIEKGAVGAGASWVAAGMLAPAGEAQWGQGPLAAACAESAGRWPAWTAELEAESSTGIGYQRCGALHVSLDRDEAVELKRRLPLIRGVDPSAEWCLPSRCREIEPGLAPGAGAGIAIDGEAVVDPRAVLDALREALRARGASVVEDQLPAELLLEGGRCAGICLESGETIAAGAVLVAAGAWSGALPWLPADATPAVRPLKGEIIRLRARAPIAQRIVHTERVYVVPRPGGEIVIGATTEDAGFDVSTSAGGVHELLREAYRVLPDIAECEFVEASAGLRPASTDGAPYLGATPIAGLHLACGHLRNGILLAPLSAEAVLAGLTGAAPPEAAAPFAVLDRPLAEARR